MSDSIPRKRIRVPNVRCRRCKKSFRAKITYPDSDITCLGVPAHKRRVRGKKVVR